MRTLLGGELELDMNASTSRRDAAIDSNQSFVERGERLRDGLLDHLHGATGARLDRRELVRWQRTALKIARAPRH